MKKILVFSIALAYSLVCLSSENKEEENISIAFNKKFNPMIEKVMNSHSIPGLSIGVVYKNEVIFAKGYGFTDINSKTPVTKDSIFHVASISKVFVGTAIMQLVEKGMIDLDKKLIDYLPEFKMKSGDYKDITIRQMLGHFSGMSNSNDYNWDKPEYDKGAIERFVNSLSSVEMDHKPGEKFRYSNIAYEVLGHLIAKVSGQSFVDYQKDNVLNKSGMLNSSFLKPKQLPDNWAKPHEVGLEPFTLDIYPFNRRHAPSSTLHTNTLEMCQWMLINLNNGSIGKNKILEKESIESMWSTQIEFDRGAVGLSWFIGDYIGNKKISHHGDDEGFQASLVLLPEQSIGVVVMANTLPAPLDEITNNALNLLLGKEMVQIKPYISIPAMSILKDKGIDKAIEFWKNTESQNFEEFDFSQNQHFNLYFATIFEREAEALLIAEFYNKVLKPEELKRLIELMEYAISKNPKNTIPFKIIKILNNK